MRHQIRAWGRDPVRRKWALLTLLYLLLALLCTGDGRTSPSSQPRGEATPPRVQTQVMLTGSGVKFAGLVNQYLCDGWRVVPGTLIVAPHAHLAVGDPIPGLHWLWVVVERPR